MKLVFALLLPLALAAPALAADQAPPGRLGGNMLEAGQCLVSALLVAAAVALMISPQVGKGALFWVVAGTLLLFGGWWLVGYILG